ncbi:MAG: preprotein translocase subunit YajC [bacterium]|nr:preprotein translocase subunit YajC [bacterium]
MTRRIVGASLLGLGSWLAVAQVWAMAGPQGEGQGQASPWNMLFIFALFMVAMYFFMIRPEQRRRKEKEEMLRSVSVGDKIVTTGGIYGIVRQVKEDTVRLQIDDHVRIELAKSAIANVVERGGEQSGAATT